jgi:acyl-CoA synthetase (AMP-forming)/AMP-acid ligase II
VGQTLAEHDWRSLRMMISGGSALTTQTKEGVLATFPACGLHEFYGATEAGVITNLRPQDQARKRRCVGRPVFDTEVVIRDEVGQELPVGEIGEIWLRGPTIFSGYFNAPEKNQAVFSGDWCTLGDVGRIDEEGYVYIVDRSKDVIKSGGVNVYPVEIEEVLLEQTGVQEVAVVGIADPTWGEAVHAVVVLAPHVLLDVEVLLTRCRERLAGYKVPKTVEFRTELPRNANGKVLKRVLRETCVV